MLMAQRRILIFNDCFFMGGTEILLVNLLNHLAEKKDCRVTLLLPNPSDKNVLLSRVSDKVEVRYLFPKEQTGLKRLLYKNLLIFFPDLYIRLVKFQEKEYDQIVCFKDCFHSIMFSRMKLFKVLWIQNQPFVRDYTSHSVREWIGYTLNRFQIARMTRSFDLYDKVVCVSDSSKDGYINIYHQGKQQKELNVLYNALDLSDIVKKAEEPIEYRDVEGLKFVVVIRLSYEKTVDRVILAVERLQAEGYKLNVTILGDGMEFDNLQELIKNKDLQQSIFMLGRVNNPFPYVKDADWFLCPSSRESFALTLLESITLGTPVITTECGGPEDVVGHGKYGILTENSNEGVYLAMKKVLDDPSLRAYYVETHEACLSRFDYSRWLREVGAILELEKG